MNNNLLPQQQRSIVVTNVPVELGVKRHFNHFERNILNGKTTSQSFFDTPINYFTELTSLTKGEAGYALKLAFFQRIQFNLSDAFQSPVSYVHYPIEQLDNFTKLDELFEKNYNSFDKINANVPKARADFKKRVTQTVFKLWLCGYGLLQGYTLRTISDTEIEYLMTRNKKVARFVAMILKDEPLSHVTLVPNTHDRITILESEKAKWDILIKENVCELAQHLYHFTFEILKGKAEGGYLLTFHLEDGATQRQALSSIRWGTFRAYSSALRKFATLMIQNGYILSIEQALSGGIIDTLSSEPFQTLPKNDKGNIKTALKIWLECYSNINSLKININRIIPISVSNKEKTYGKLLNFGSVHALISTLLEDQSDTFDENKLFHLRARRACLIQLVTGKRLAEVLLLKRNCLQRDAEGNVFIHFHKTKNGEPHTLPATKDLVQWVKQLQTMAPNSKIKISSEEYYYGDDETDYRLFANIYDDGPLLVSSINNFLRDVQEKLWSNVSASRYYTSHDLRRMNAVYMKIKGKSTEDIQEQLGQLSIDSQLPYLETKPPDIQAYYKKIAEKGIWSHLVEISESQETANGTPLEQTLKRAQKQSLTSEGKESAKLFLENIISRVEKQKGKLPNNTGKQPLSTGFPIRTHNCLATEIVNCGHTELHCFSCHKYMPDSDKLEEHKAEILRYILLLSHNDDLAKKNKLEREVITYRSEDIKELLNETFQNLFKKFEIDAKATKNIEKQLYSKAKTYYRKYKKTKPTLTFLEALIFLKEGVING